MAENQETYNVVFAYTRQSGGYEGVITFTFFKDEEHFDKSYNEDIRKRQRVLAEGVTPDEAVEMVQQTPLACDLATTLQEATNPKTGEVEPSILEMDLRNVAFARRL